MDASDVESWESVPRGYVNLPFVDRPTSMWPRRCLVAGVGLIAAGASAVMLFDCRFAPQLANRTLFGKATENLVSAYGFAPTTAEEGVMAKDGTTLWGMPLASSIPSAESEPYSRTSRETRNTYMSTPAPVVATGGHVEAVWTTTSPVVIVESSVDVPKTAQRPAPVVVIGANIEAIWTTTSSTVTVESSLGAPKTRDSQNNPSWAYHRGDTLQSRATTSIMAYHRGDTLESRATTSYEPATQVSTVTSTKSHPLFCWALMMPHGYEVSLVRTLLNHGAGIFTCEDWTVFSEGHVELSPGPPVRIITEDVGSVKCDFGGPWHLALNSEVFIKVWRKVFAEKKYLKAGWTVKVDPDAVVLPDRLRAMMVKSDPDANVYFNNCDQGLHGPIEILARGGMEVFRRGIDKCVKALSHEFDQAGEDVFLRHCLGLLNVSRVDNFHLLSEDRCMWENPVQTGCVSGKVAFHPFKKPETYFKCLQQARDHHKDRDRVRAVMK